MLVHSSEELALLSQASRGDVAGALAAIEQMRPSLTHGRYVLLRGQVRVMASAAYRSGVLDEYLSVLKECRHDAATFMLLLVTGSAYACLGNKSKAMRELMFFDRQADLWFPGHEAVRYWRGLFLVNCGNHFVRQRDYAKALALLDQAISLIEPISAHRGDLTRAQYLRAWCLTELGRLCEARNALAEMAAGDVKAAHEPHYLLGLSRVLLAEGDVQGAARLARDAREGAASQEHPDGQVLVEAGYQELLAALKSGHGDVLPLARAVVTLAHQYGIAHIINQVKRALLAHGYRRRKEAQ